MTLKFIQRTWLRIEKNGESKWDRYEYKLEEHELGSADVKTDDKGQGAYNWRVPITGSISGKQGRAPIQGLASTGSPSGNSFCARGSARSTWTGVGGASRWANSAPVVRRMPRFIGPRKKPMVAISPTASTPAAISHQTQSST